MGFCFSPRRLSPDQKWSVPFYSACRLNDQTLRALAEAPAQHPADDPTPGTIAQIPTSPKSNASCLTSCCS